MSNIFRKIIVIIIITIPAFTDPGCKKQAKCGCDGDILFELDREQVPIYYDENSARFSPVNNPYATYYFCNPGEMYPKLKDYDQGDLVLISGYVYWNCNYLYSTSNYSYSYSYLYKAYDIQVTDITVNLYGKK